MQNQAHWNAVGLRGVRYREVQRWEWGCEPGSHRRARSLPASCRTRLTSSTEEGYLAHKKMPNPLGPPQGPRHAPTPGSQEEAFFYERGIPVEYMPPGIPRPASSRARSLPVTWKTSFKSQTMKLGSSCNSRNQALSRAVGYVEGLWDPIESHEIGACQRERVDHRQPTGPKPLYHRDD